MTHVKINDILKLTSDDEELNGIFLVGSIHSSEIVLRSPPNHEYTLNINDGVIDHVLSVEVVHSAKSSGFIDKMGFSQDKTVCITFSDGQETCGNIQAVESDMIDVELEDKTHVYIDFEYEGLPEGVQSIVLDNPLQFEEVEEHFLFPEKNRRYPIANQLTDLMDSLLVQKQQGANYIKQANLIVKRFKELKTLFTTEDQEPRILPSEYKPLVLPHQVKWIVPSVNVTRPLYTGEESFKFWEEMATLQNSRGRYDSIQKTILEQLSPYNNDMGGQPVEHHMMTVIPKGKYRRSKCDDEGMTDHSKKWLIQMVDAPYKGSVTTEYERVKPLGYYTLQHQSIDFTRLFLPQTKMMDRQVIHSQSFFPLFDDHRHCVVLSQCVPSIKDMIESVKDTLSVYDTIRSLEPYLVYDNDVLVKYNSDLITPVSKRIEKYKRRKIPPPYVSNSTNQMTDEQYRLPSLSPSEWMCTIQKHDFGTLHLLIQQQKLNIEYLQKVDDKFKLAEQQPVSPPVAKIYTTLAQVKKDKGTIFWDTALDTTNYQEFVPYSTKDTLLQYLVDMKQMPVPLAKLYAPHFLTRKKVIINGDYAKMNETYFRRVDNDWVLDETCNGPYPCASNEPDCEEDCVDIVFRLNENLKSSILGEMTPLPYVNEPARIKTLTKSIERANYLLQRKQMLTKMNEYKYNQRKLGLKGSISMTTSSAYQPLLLFILQKPHYERYKELQSFINMYTRPATKGEKESWLYCTATNTPLVPHTYTRILEVYAIPERYDALIKALLISNDIKREEDMYVLTESGYPVGPTEYSQVFDDLVRSSELNESVLFDIPRLVHEDTPVIIQLLSEIGNLIKYPMAKYFNFIVHDMDKRPSMYIQLAIAYMFKIASIVYSLNIQDAITLVLAKQAKLVSIMKQNGFKEEYVLNEKSIHSSIVLISSNFVIQQLLYYKEKKLGDRTRHTIWNTFLPPLEVKPIKVDGPHPIKILYLLNESIQSKPQLRQGNYMVNTCEATFLEKQMVDQLSHFKRPIMPPYTREKTFTPKSFIPDYDEAKFNIMKFTLNGKELIQEQHEDFVERMTDTRKRLNRCVTIPETFLSNTPISFLKEFIYFIAKIMPEKLKNGVRYDFEIPSYTTNILSMTHKTVLNNLSVHHYLNKIQETFPDTAGLGIHSILSSVEVEEMLKRVELPTHPESSIYEFRYYIFRIFEMYLTHSDLSKTCVLVKMYIDLFIKERDKVFLSYEEIKRYTLKIKAKESNDRRVSLLGLSPADKAVYQFREQNNLENSARLARLRTYNPDVFESLFSTFHGDQGEDIGTDGTHHDEEFE